MNGHTSFVWSVAFSQDGSRIASGSQDKSVCIWNLKTGEMETELKDHMDVVRSATFFRDDRRVLSGSDDKKVRIWDVTTGKMDTELDGRPDSLSAVALSFDTGGIVPQSFEDIVISIHNVLSGTLQPHNLLSLSYDGDCCVRTVTVGSPMATFSGSRACFGCVGGRVIILDMAVVQ